MKINIKRWIIMETIRNFANSIVTLFFSIYIWERSKTLDSVLTYHMALFVAIPIFGYVSGFLLKRIRPAVILNVSNIIECAAVVIVIIFPQLIISKPYLLGIFMAGAIGFYSTCRNVVFSELMSIVNISNVTAKLASLSRIINIGVPFIGSLWVYISGSYSGIFILATGLYMVASYLTFTIEMPYFNNNWVGFKKLIENSDYKKLLLYFFFQGNRNGITWALLGILTLNMVNGNLPVWGIVTFGLGVLGVLSGLFYSKHLSKDKNVIVFMFTNLLVAASIPIFLANYNVWSLVFFLSVNEISTSFLNASGSPIVYGIISEAGNNNLFETYWLTELPLALGRVLPLLILYISTTDLSFLPSIAFIFMVLGLVPIAIAATLRGTRWVVENVNY